MNHILRWFHIVRSYVVPTVLLIGLCVFIYYVRMFAQVTVHQDYTDIESVRQLRISPKTRLRDIADVSYREPERKWRVRANSRPAVALVVIYVLFCLRHRPET